MATGNTDLPMSDFHKKVLTKGLREIVENMKAVDLLNQLISDDCLSLRESKKIENQDGIDEQNKELVVTLLQGKPDQAYQCFLDALEGNRQSHVADIVRKKEVEVRNEIRAKTQCTRQPLQETSQPCLPHSRSCPTEALTEAETPEIHQRSSSEGMLVKQSNPLALLLPPQGGKASTKERQKRKVSGTPRLKPLNTHAKDSCMVGMKVSVFQLCIGDEDWIDGCVFEHILELEAFIWMILSMNFKHIDSQYSSHQVAQCLRLVGCEGREVIHIGLQPVQFIVHCTSDSSLEKLGKLDDSTLGESLEDALMTTFLKERYNLTGLTIETSIHSLEYGLCKRILNGEVQTIGLRVAPTSADGTQLMIAELEEVLLEKSVMQSSHNDTPISNAMSDINTSVDCVRKSSVLFTLRFTATEDLEVFRSQLESGQLTQVFEEALLTEDMRIKYQLDSLNLSLTLSDPWEYEMCWVELAYFEDQTSTEDSTEEAELTDELAFETEDSDNELPRCCFENRQVIEHLQKANTELKDKCNFLQQELNKYRELERIGAVPYQQQLQSQHSGKAFDTRVDNDKLTRDEETDTKNCVPQTNPAGDTVTGATTAQGNTSAELSRRIAKLEEEKAKLAQTLTQVLPILATVVSARRGTVRRESDRREGDIRTDDSELTRMIFQIPSRTADKKDHEKFISSKRLPSEDFKISKTIGEEKMTDDKSHISTKIVEDTQNALDPEESLTNSLTGTARETFQNRRHRPIETKHRETPSETVGGSQRDVSATQHEPTSSLDSNQIRALQEKVEDLTKETARLRQRENVLTEKLDDIQSLLRKVPYSSVKNCELDDSLRMWLSSLLVWSEAPQTIGFASIIFESRVSSCA